MADTNSIMHIAEFEKSLRNYIPNIEVIDLLNQLTFVLLIAPAAAGRNTIIKNLIMTGKYYYLVSDTTRKPRINNGVPERDGEEYWFRNENEMLDGIRRGEYLEAAIIHRQQVSGTSIHELRKALETGRMAITDMDIQGSDYLQAYAPEAKYVFILPPDFDEWMRRMDGRGAMDPQEKRRRLESALREISDALERPYFKYVINWDLRSTTEMLHSQLMTGKFDSTLHMRALDHANELIKNIHEWIRSA